MSTKKISKAIPFKRPTDDRLMKYRNMKNDSLPRFSTSNMAGNIDEEEEEKNAAMPQPESGGDMLQYKEGPLKGLPKRT